MRTPILLVPGLLCSARIFAAQIPALWQFGPVTVADHAEGDSVETIARAILATAPPRFALVGYSMGGYLTFEMLRQARERIERLALIDTSARPDSPEHIRVRKQRIAATQAGRYEETVDTQFPFLVHHTRSEDAALRDIYRIMTRETGPERFIRHLTATMNRPDSRPELGLIRCPTLIAVGQSDRVTLPEWSEEMAAGIPHARSVVIVESGHMSPLEQPEVLNRLLAEWVTD